MSSEVRREKAAHSNAPRQRRQGPTTARGGKKKNRGAKEKEKNLKSRPSEVWGFPSGCCKDPHSQCRGRLNSDADQRAKGRGIDVKLGGCRSPDASN